MTVWIGQATHDEHGRLHGGKPGDQTGREVALSRWAYGTGSYNKWTHVFRAKNKTIAKKMAYAIVAACYNKKVGYDTTSGQRSSFYDQAKKVGWDPAKVKKKCETTCSQVVGVCISYAGISTPRKVVTNGLKRLLLKNKNFQCFTSSKYRKQSKYLEAGDILITSGHHTAMVAAVGLKPSSASAYYKKLFSGATTTTQKTTTTTTKKTTKTTTKKTTTTKKKTGTTASVHYASQVTKINHMKAIDTIAADWEKLNKYYGNAYKTQENNIKKYDNIKPNTILTHYTQMLDILSKKIHKVDKVNENNYYLHFLNNKNGLLQYISPKNRNENNVYYTASTSSLNTKDWMNKLYNDIYLKKVAIECYIEAQKKYIPVLKTDKYLNELYKDMEIGGNTELSIIYQQLQNFVETHINTFNNADSLKKINEEIDECQNNINSINQNLYKDHSDRMNIEQLLKKYQTILNNLLKTKLHFKDNNFSDIYTYWNKNIIQEPNLLNFWLEFSIFNETNNYRVKNIGRRAYAEDNEQVTSVYYRNTPQVIYYNNDNIEKNKTGYIYLKINDIDSLFKNSAQGLSAKNIIDDLLYQYTYCPQQLTLSIIPIHYLEPNTRVLLYNEKTKVNNEYIINKISNPINYNGNMTINVTQVSDRLY